MTIDKLTLFDTTRALWPETINVAHDPDATIKIYRSNQEAFPQEDDWRQLALWAFHQAMGVHERRALAKGLPNVYPSEVSFSEFDARMRANLNGADCWTAERAEYEEG